MREDFPDRGTDENAERSKELSHGVSDRGLWDLSDKTPDGRTGERSADISDVTGCEEADGISGEKPAGESEKISVPTPTKRRRLPRFYLGVFCYGGAVAVLYLLFRLSVPLSDFFSEWISPAIRGVMTFLSGAFPFSLYEALLLSVPVLIFLFIWLFLAGKRSFGRIVSFLLSCFIIGTSLFVFSTAPGYFGTSVADRLSLEGDGVTSEDMADALEYLVGEIGEILETESFATLESGETLMEGNIFDVSRKIVAAYGEMPSEFSFIKNVRSAAKPAVTGEAMTYLHLAGIYTAFTGEITVNTEYPDFIVVSTVAHEMAHQRGIAKEDEANFIAFAVLDSSGDPYLRYSGLLDAYSAVATDLAASDYESYREIASRLPRGAKRELAAYGDFFEKYRDSTASKVSNAANDAFLKSQGTEGTVAYSLSSRLIAAYLRDR